MVCCRVCVGFLEHNMTCRLTNWFTGQLLLDIFRLYCELAKAIHTRLALFTTLDSSAEGHW